jgi:hypothetical protein
MAKNKSLRGNGDGDGDRDNRSSRVQYIHEIGHKIIIILVHAYCCDSIHQWCFHYQQITMYTAAAAAAASATMEVLLRP